MRHNIHPELLTRKVRVCLIGAGGTGSVMLSGLARLHLSLVAKGHPGGIDVDVYDDDVVSESNCARQLFYPSDIGFSKPVVLCHRLNLAYNLGFKAIPKRFDRNTAPQERFDDGYDIYISCVDSIASRRELAYILQQRRFSRPVYYLDSGNRLDDGQVVLGEPHTVSMPTRRERALPMRLRCIYEFFPELLAENTPEDDTPSCSLAEALEKQSLFICQEMATKGLNLLWRLFSDGGLNYHGQFSNLKTGRVTPILIDKTVWKKMIPKMK